MHRQHDDDAVTIAAAVGDWREAGGPEFRNLAGAIRQLIVGGGVQTGQRLPTQRALAQQLGTNRSTVVAAYDLLSKTGWLYTRRGSGTFVAGGQRTAGVNDESAGGDRGDLQAILAAGDDRLVDMTNAALPGSDVITRQLWNDAYEEVERVAAGHGYAPYGLTELREAIASYYNAAGLPTTPDEVLVTTGAQHAIYLIASMSVRPGTVVAMESPTWVGAIDVVRTLGAEVRPVGLDADGASALVLAELTKDPAAALLYVSPTVNNPTGLLMPEERRQALAEIIDEAGLMVIEDDCLADLVFERARPPAPLAAFTRSDGVLTVGSLSKVGWGGLRVGWIRASPELIRRLASVGSMTQLGGAMVSQVLALQLLARIDEVRQARQQLALERLGLLTDLLRQRLPEWTWTDPDGGLSLWVELSEGNAEEFSRVALGHGVAVVPGTLPSVERRHRRHVRLSFVREEKDMRVGVERLEAAWKTYVTRLRDHDAAVSVFV